MRVLGFLSSVVLVCLWTAEAPRGADDSVEKIDRMMLLPMGALPKATLPASEKRVREDAALRTFAVSLDNRPARVVRGPQQIVRTLPGGTRFQTSLAPIDAPATFTIAVAGGPDISITAEPGKWTVARADLPPRKSVQVTETLTAGANQMVLWADDRLIPLGVSRKHPDIILVSLDTTRPDYLTPYDSRESSTPALARLASEGMRFDQATSVTSWTMPAHAAVLTGHYPNIGLGFGSRVEPTELTLAELLSMEGYDTRGASGGPYTDAAAGFQQGFRSYVDSSGWKNAAFITDWAVDVVSNTSKSQPLFLFMNYFDAHEPTSGVSIDEWIPVDTGAKPLTDDFVRRIRAGYRRDLRTIDDQLARLFAAFRSQRDWDNTIVVVFGDHGQLLGERGAIGHAISLDEELLRVPVLVKGTRSRPLRGVYPEQFQLHDLFPVMLDLAGLATPDKTMVPRLRARQPIRALAFAQLHHDPDPELTKRPRWRSVEQWAVRTDTMKVVRDREGRVTTVSVGRDVERPVTAPEITRRLLAELDAFSAATTKPAGSLWQVPPEMRDRLRALGYIR